MVLWTSIWSTLLYFHLTPYYFYEPSDNQINIEHARIELDLQLKVGTT